MNKWIIQYLFMKMANVCCTSRLAGPNIWLSKRETSNCYEHQLYAIGKQTTHCFPIGSDKEPRQEHAIEWLGMLKIIAT